VTTAGIVCDQQIITMDWTATMIAAGGGPATEYPLDGEDIEDLSVDEHEEATLPMRTRKNSMSYANS
jgi:hypothetical protein